MNSSGSSRKFPFRIIHRGMKQRDTISYQTKLIQFTLYNDDNDMVYLPSILHSRIATKPHCELCCNLSPFPNLTCDNSFFRRFKIHFFHRSSARPGSPMQPNQCRMPNAECHFPFHNPNPLPINRNAKNIDIYITRASVNKTDSSVSQIIIRMILYRQ